MTGILMIFGQVWGHPYKETAVPLVFGGMAFVLVSVVILDYRAVVRDFIQHVFVQVVRATLPVPQSDGAAGRPKSNQEVDDIIRKGGADVLYYGSSPPPADEWNKAIRPVLHQASYYSTPTYYLDPYLKIVDWNLAFDVVFSHLTGNLRMLHVNHFIAQLTNQEEVFQRAREFSQVLPPRPFHNELLVYTHPIYGEMRFSKFATKLFDRSGIEQGWAVGLFIRRMEPGGRKWSLLEEDLVSRFEKDVTWNEYSASYDQILKLYSPYDKLLEDIVSAIPAGNTPVLDLGAGTGNTVEKLLAKGHQVVAVENNLAMLDRLRNRSFADQIEIIKSSVEHLDMLELDRRKFKAATMVNVLYALDNPPGCLTWVNKLLPVDGVLSISTPFKEVESLAPLLADIKQKLVQQKLFTGLELHYERLRIANERLEPLAVRYSVANYKQWIESAGFSITKEIPRTYSDAETGAVMVVHARKIRDVGTDSSSFSPALSQKSGTSLGVPDASGLFK